MAKEALRQRSYPYRSLTIFRTKIEINNTQKTSIIAYSLNKNFKEIIDSSEIYTSYKLCLKVVHARKQSNILP